MKDILTPEFIAVQGKPNVIILRSPNGITDAIVEAEPDKIVYVSCNPATQARDTQCATNMK